MADLTLQLLHGFIPAITSTIVKRTLRATAVNWVAIGSVVQFVENRQNGSGRRDIQYSRLSSHVNNELGMCTQNCIRLHIGG